MRSLMVCLVAAAGLRAQAPLSGEEALRKFKQKLESLTKRAGVAGKVCAIPLLKVRPVPQSVDRRMAIGPKVDDHTRFHIVQVIPPAPPCGEGNVLWKE